MLVFIFRFQILLCWCCAEAMKLRHTNKPQFSLPEEIKIFERLHGVSRISGTGATPAQA